MITNHRLDAKGDIWLRCLRDDDQLRWEREDDIFDVDHVAFATRWSHTLMARPKRAELPEADVQDKETRLIYRHRPAKQHLGGFYIQMSYM